MDYDAGIFLRFNNKVGRRRVTQNIGFGASHLTRPDESLTNIESRLPIKFSFYESTMFSSRFKATFVPNALYEQQQNFRSLRVGTDILWNVQMTSFCFEISYRRKFPFDNLDANDALILGAGYRNLFQGKREKNYQILYTYDFTISRLVNQSGGSHEISIIVNLEDVLMTRLRTSAAARKASDCKNFKPGFMPVNF